jgi:hypothetical protein
MDDEDVTLTESTEFDIKNVVCCRVKGGVVVRGRRAAGGRGR